MSETLQLEFGIQCTFVLALGLLRTRLLLGIEIGDPGVQPAANVFTGHYPGQVGFCHTVFLRNHTNGKARVDGPSTLSKAA